MAKVTKKEARDIAWTAYMKEFLAGAIALALEDKSMKELTYIKTPVQMPDGGLYLVSILHVEGPKLDLETLRLVQESQDESKETPEQKEQK